MRTQGASAAAVAAHTLEAAPARAPAAPADGPAAITPTLTARAGRVLPMLLLLRNATGCRLAMILRWLVARRVRGAARGRTCGAARPI